MSERFEVYPEDEEILIKKKKIKKIKKEYKDQINNVVKEVLETESLKEYEKQVLDWKWGE